MTAIEWQQIYSTYPWIQYDWNTGDVFPLTESLPVIKRRLGHDGTYLDGASSRGVVSMVLLVCKYNHVDLSACDDYVRTNVAIWEETPDEPGSQTATDAVGIVATNELRAEAVQMRS